jgi:alkanesulfonate monooxygenase SsuD/methylene tetrahydromethanopterin reductase-like flavin-dependent oxidoreductase (luciferase family)
VQQPPDVWLGGLAPSELRRIGRLGDGWLPSFCTPADIERSRPIIEAAASDASRELDSEHWGALVAYTDGPIPDLVAAAIAARRPDLEQPSDVIASGIDGLRDRLERFVAAGASKFVIVPLTEPDNWDAALSQVGEALLPMQKAA